MIKKISILGILLTILVSSCHFGKKSDEYADQRAKVKEVIQTTNYTYLRVEKNNQEQWIAIGKMDVKEGATVYFTDGLEMQNFESPELGRTFESVLFVQEISDEPIRQEGMPSGVHGGMSGGDESPVMGDKPQKPVLTKIEVKIQQPAGGISIGDLYSRKADFAGKAVTVRGQVTKVNYDIMGHNWVHIQDGTGSGENFDLTVTTTEEPEVGDIVTYSGKLTLNKDFGYGYFYDIIIEDAASVNIQ